MWYVVDDGDTVLAGPFHTHDAGIDGILAVSAGTSEPVRLVRYHA